MPARPPGDKVAVEQIAFEDSGYFNRFFKKQVRISAGSVPPQDEERWKPDTDDFYAAWP
jgi:AraC-like DNA-binding protein